MYKVLVIIAAMAIVAGIVPISATVTAQTEENLINAITGGFESIAVVQDANQIVITITKGPGEEPTNPLPDNGTVPTDPIIIVPDPGGEGNGTVIVPLPPSENATIPSGGNVTEPGEPPVIVVDPGNNDTIVVEPPTNVTQIDNGTVIIHPPEQNVTETPGNVTVVDPPVANVTEPGTPSECGCPIGVPGAPPDIQLPPVMGENITSPILSNNTNITVVEEPPVPTELPTDEQAQESNDNGNNGDGGGDGGGN